MADRLVNPVPVNPVPMNPVPVNPNPVNPNPVNSKPENPPKPPHGVTRILGIDPGLNITGYGVLEVVNGGLRVVEAGVIRGRERGSLELRLGEIHSGVREVLAAFSPSGMAIEQLYSHYERPRTAILMGHARGVICLAAVLAEVPVHHYAATQVKRLLTGSGRAPKLQVQQAVQRELRLRAVPDPPDVADAMAVALCHYYLAVAQRAL